MDKSTIFILIRFICTTWIITILQTVESFTLDMNFPLIYEDPQIKEAQRPTYFGYSLLAYSRDGYTWIQIAAPRANDTRHPKITEPGLIYRCSLGNLCSPYVFDLTGNEDTYEYRDRKDNAWLGATMALHQKADLLAVCAPRWKNTKSLSEWMIPGACYSVPASNRDHEAGSAYKMLPLLGHETYNQPSWGSKSVYDYAMGQAGMSACFPDDKGNDPIELLLGAPGIMNWKGSTILMKDNGPLPGLVNKRATTVGTGMMSDGIVPMMITGAKDEKFKSGDYFGYAVAAGYFFSTTKRLYVSSAPRANNFRGRVMLYEFPTRTRVNINLLQTLNGDPGAGYFGATMTVADLNNDSYDDLLVSSPMLTEPKVHIFVGSRRGSLIAPTSGLTELVGTSIMKGNSRFGLALVAADLDIDGYKEVLVGAPFAEDGRGAIAIWRGGSTGLRGTGAPALVLRPSDFDPVLRGFGMSIAPPVDLDGNYFPEVVIGSFMSSHAIVLRGRPVAKLGVILGGPDVTRLVQTSTSLDIPMCLTYSAYAFQLTPIKVTLVTVIDNTFKRAYLKGQPQTSHVNKEKFLLRERSKCDKKIQIVFKKGIKNFLDPIEITVNLTIEDYTSGMKIISINKDRIRGQDGFNKFYPTSEIAFAKLNIPFETDCGTDNICNADLSISIATEGHLNKFVLGSFDTLRLEIAVANIGEPAYLTQIILYLQSPATLARLPPTCSTQANSSILCDLDNPLREGIPKSLWIEVDMRDVSATFKDKDIITFTAQALTKSLDINKNNNEVNLTLSLAIDATVGIVGKSSQDKFSYVKTEEGESKDLVLFKHLYEVQKFGNSPVEQVLIKVKIPYAYKTKGGPMKFLSIYYPEAYQSGQPFSCTPTDFSFDYDTSLDENIAEDYTEIESSQNRSKRYINKVFNHKKNEYFYPLFTSTVDTNEIKNKKRTKRSDQNNIIYQNKTESALPSNRTVTINCDHKEIICVDIECLAGPFRRTQVVSRLRLTMKINFSVIQDTVMKKKDILVLDTKGSAIIVDSHYNEVAAVVSSVFVNSPANETVALWLIILSVVLGLILLTLIIFGLVKAGFFERKKKEELERLKKSECVEPIDPDADFFEESPQYDDTDFALEDKDPR